MQNKMLLFIVCICYSISTNAQTITPATLNISGGYINLGYNQFEWSVGESSVIETLTQTGINGAILTNGVLQPLTDKPFAQSVSNNWSNDEIRIFPSPTTGNFEVDILSKEQGQLTIQLVDGQGRSIKSVQYAYYGFGKIERFNITQHASSNFYLRVTLSAFPGFADKKGSFKILKIN
jgi:hypothetical protein